MSKNFHPLNMLSASEISDAVSILKQSNKTHENTSFSYISLEEPEKKLLKENTNLDRIVKIVGVSKESRGFEASISLSKKEVLKEEEISINAGPTYTLSEIFKAIELTMENEDYQKALKKRGIEDLSLIQIDPWPGGGFVNKNIKNGNRALRAISFLKYS